MKGYNFTNPTGETYEWVKKTVQGKEIQYYLDSPGYRLVKKGSTGAVFAFRRALSIGPREHHLEACTPYEIQKLEA